MEDDHAGLVFRNKKNTNSIFTLFSNLMSEKNEDPKYCVDLMKTLRGEQFNVGSTSNFVYSIKRLVTALGSTRSHSQCGSFAALTCLLKYGICSVENVLHALEKEVRNIHGYTKSEIRAFDMECVLACGAIIHSGRFAEQSAAIQQSVLTKLIEGGKKKSYLTTVAYRFLTEAVQLSDEVHFKECVWPICKGELLEQFNELNWSVECFHFVTICMIKSPKTLTKFFKKKSSSDILYLEKLIDYLFSNSIKNTHPVYESTAKIMCAKPNDMVTLWSKCVENNGKINVSKDNQLVTLFFNIMKHLKQEKIIPLLLVPNFVEILIKVLTFKKFKTQEDNNSLSTGKTALTLMVELLSKEGTPEETKLNSIYKLLLFPANMKFEVKTGTKVIQQLVSHLKSESIIKLLEIYKQVICDDIRKVISDDNEENWNAKEKQIALWNLVRTINHPSIRDNIPLKLEQIKFIFKIGFLNSNTITSIEFKNYAKECFYKAVMLQMQTLKDLVYLLDELVIHVNGHIEKKSFEVSEEMLEWWNKQFSAVQELQKDSNKFFIALHVLLIYMGFQLFLDYDLAKSSIQELLSCYSHIKQIEAKEREKKRKSGNKNSCAGELHWTEVTVDLILSLLSRENRLWRHVITCIFPQVVSHATPMALRQIVDALDPKSENVVLEELNSDDSMSSGDEESESTSGPDESELEDCDQEEKANDQLRMAVREALGYSAALTDDESVDMDQMNEEEEKKLNESLAEAFRMFKPGSRSKKKKQTKEEESLMHFRLRVLDLVEIYIFNKPSMQGCLDLIIPLLNLLELSIKDVHQTPLRTRIEAVIRSVAAVKEFSGTQNVDETYLKDIFRGVINKKEISALVFVEMSARISDCTTFLVRCCQVLPTSDDGDVACCLVDDYNLLLKAFFQTRDLKLPFGMFQSVMRMTWTGSFKLVGTLFEFLSTSTIRIFKKMKVIELLQLFYKNEKLHSSSGEGNKSELTQDEVNFIDGFCCFLKRCAECEFKTTERIYATFFSQIITLVNVMWNNVRKHRPSSHEENHSSWKNLVLALAQTETVCANKKTRSQLMNLAYLLNASAAVAQRLEKKRKGSREQEEQEPEEEVTSKSKTRKADEMTTEEPKKKKKKQMSNGRLNIIKKEKRKLREVPSSDLKVFRFSSVDLESLQIA